MFVIDLWGGGGTLLIKTGMYKIKPQLNTK